MALDVGAIAANLRDLVAMEVVEFSALGRDACVGEGYAGVVGVVLLLEQEVLAAFREFNLVAVVAAGVIRLGADVEDEG